MILGFGFLLTSPAAGETAWFTGLGDLPGGEHYSSALAVSEDHRVVVGFGVTGPDISDHRDAFRWSREEGMIRLEAAADDTLPTYSMAVDVSADGSVIVGRVGRSNLDIRPFRWTNPDGMVVLLGRDGRRFRGTAQAVSADGRIIAGALIVSSPSSEWTEAFRWTGEAGIVRLADQSSYTGEPGNEIWSFIRALSDDGAILVGGARVPGTQGVGEMITWTVSEGLERNGKPTPGSYETWPEAISADGGVVAGSYWMGSGARAFRWSASTGFADLWESSQADYASNYAYGISGDGTVVIGQYTEGRNMDFRAFVWDEVKGRRDLKEMLIDDYGLDESLEGWELDAPNAISNDGRMIVGRGRNPLDEVEAFAVYLGDPVVEADVPVIVAQPAPQVSEFGRSASFSVDAEAVTGPGLTYQWKLNGMDIPGATGPTLDLPMVQRFQTGQYTVEVTNGPHTVTSTAAMLTAEEPEPSGARLLNLSTRAFLPTVDSLSIPGFVIVGSGTKEVLLRGVSASLRLPPFNLESAMGDPRLMLGTVERFAGGGVFTSIEENDALEDSANRAAILDASLRVGAFPITDERDGAILVDLPAGAYTAWVSSQRGDPPTGEALAEIYDADDGESSTELVNISTRGHIGVDGSVLIPGFVVSSDGPLTLLVRVVGPTLGTEPFNLPDANPDPRLTLFGTGSDGASPLLFSNEDWEEQPDAAYTAEIASRVGAFALDSGGKDAAIVLTLPPGAYTAVGSSADGMNTGLALVEIYVVPPTRAE